MKGTVGKAKAKAQGERHRVKGTGSSSSKGTYQLRHQFAADITPRVKVLPVTSLMVWLFVIPMSLVFAIANGQMAVSAQEALIVQALATHNGVFAAEQLVAS